jgi:hypothetical protein
MERWAAAVCTTLAAGLLLGPYLWRADLFNNDAAHHIFWLYRYADATLFPDDIAVDYFKTSGLWGYRALYASVAPVFDVLSAAEWLSIALLIWCAMLAWKIGVAASGSNSDRHGLLAVMALCLMLQWSQQRDLLPPIAFQRSFALPLLLLTLWGLVSGRYLWVGVSWLAAALVYPVVLPVQGLTAALVFASHLAKERQMPPVWAFNLLAGSVAIAVAAIGVPIPSEIGPALTYDQAMRRPEFGPTGRLGMYGEGLRDFWLRDHRTGLGWSGKVLALIVASVIVAYAGKSMRRIPPAAWAMLLVGVVIWAAMRAFPSELMFGLYLPNRHARWAIGAFGVLALAAAASVTIDQATRRFWASAGDDTKRLRLSISVLVPVVVMAALAPHALSVWRQPVDSDLENVYRFIATLPKDALVAAHPDLADFVPVRSRRSVLTSTEISMAWMEGYYRLMKPRVEASLRAAYATRIEEVDCQLAPSGVDVMLTGPSVWTKTDYFAPFDELVGDLVERGRRQGFALQHPPNDRVLFRSGEYYVIRVDACVQDDHR